jgi:hypothetical protein
MWPIPRKEANIIPDRPMTPHRSGWPGSRRTRESTMGKLLTAIYLVVLACAGIGIGHYGAKYYRMKTSKCKPCELAASAPNPVAPGEGISNP